MTELTSFMLERLSEDGELVTCRPIHTRHSPSAGIGSASCKRSITRATMLQPLRRRRRLSRCCRPDRDTLSGRNTFSTAHLPGQHSTTRYRPRRRSDIGRRSPLRHTSTTLTELPESVLHYVIRTLESVVLNEAIREVVVLTESEMRRNRVLLRMLLAADIPPIVGDRVQLQQVVLNLILNGIEAMSTVQDHPRELVIRTERGQGDDEVCVGVQDSGIGLDPKSRERLFDAFHSTKPDGLGLGLSISRSIVEGHGGRLWAVSNDGTGATFQFTLLKYR